MAAGLLAACGPGQEPVPASQDPPAKRESAAPGRGEPGLERSPDPAPLTITVLRVSSAAGGGDAILVADSAIDPPRHVLIDAGDDATAARALREAGLRTLDLLVLTHAHHDHYGGMDEVLDAVTVRAFAFNGQVRTATTYRRLLERIEREVPFVIVVDSVRRVRLGEGEGATTLTLLPPLPSYLGADTDRGERLNEGSLAVRIERGAFSFLTTGDAEHEANRRFSTRFPELVDVDVLKLGHHGSRDATDPAWLAATTPEAAIVSANGTTHPHAAVLTLLKERGIPLYCTPQHGAVRVRVAPDGAYHITTGLPAVRECAPGRSQ
ncbi:MAG TPA: MBL fold metallo-hydrolase [Longimicrobiales bacterium]